MVTPADERRAEAVERARAAMMRSEAALRRLGAVGEIGLGLDPALPAHEAWWARCRIGRTDAPPFPLLAAGYASAADALAALAELAARPRRS